MEVETPVDDSISPVNSVDVPFGDSFPAFPSKEPNSVDETPFEAESQDFKIPCDVSNDELVLGFKIIGESHFGIGPESHQYTANVDSSLNGQHFEGCSCVCIDSCGNNCLGLVSERIIPGKNITTELKVDIVVDADIEVDGDK